VDNPRIESVPPTVVVAIAEGRAEPFDGRLRPRPVRAATLLPALARHARPQCTWKHLGRSARRHRSGAAGGEMLARTTCPAPPPCPRVHRDSHRPGSSARRRKARNACVTWAYGMARTVSAPDHNSMSRCTCLPLDLVEKSTSAGPPRQGRPVEPLGGRPCAALGDIARTKLGFIAVVAGGFFLRDQ